MAFEADKVVVELIAKTEGLDAPIRQSATQFSTSMDKIAASATKAEAAVSRSSSGSASAVKRDFAQASQAMQLFGTQTVSVGDLLASDRSPFVVPVKEGPKAVTAFKGLATAAGIMGGVLETVSGVGIALLVAGLIEMITRSGDAGKSIDDLVGKLKERYRQTLLNDEAQRIFDRTVEGSIGAMRKLTDEVDKQNLTLEDNINLKKAAIASGLANIQANIGAVSADLAAAVQRLVSARKALADAESGNFGSSTEAASAVGAASIQVRAADELVRSLTAQLLGLSRASDAASKALGTVDFPLIERNAKNAVNPIAAINQKFDDMASSAKKAGAYTQAFANDLELQRQAALEAAKAMDKAAKSAGEYGRRIGFSEASAIASGAGLTVTSAYRSTARQRELYNDPAVNRPGNPVAAPGTSAHEGVNGKWALDIAFAPGLTPQSLKKLYGDEGVTLSAVYKESGHFHIEGSRADAAATREAAAAEEKRKNNLLDLLSKESEVTIEIGKQASLVPEITKNTLEAAAAEDALRKYLQGVSQEMWQAKNIGRQLVDDVLNPSNWEDWGAAGKRILKDLEAMFIRLALINPIKNALFGDKWTTLGSLAGLFGGGFDQSGFALTEASNAAELNKSLAGGLQFRASGGPVSAGQPYVVGEQGPELFVPGASGSVVPNNARAASPLSGGTATVLVSIEASDYFDGRVLAVTGPVIASASTRAAQGGSALARQSLANSALHRLG